MASLVQGWACRQYRQTALLRWLMLSLSAEHLMWQERCLEKFQWERSGPHSRIPAHVSPAMHKVAAGVDTEGCPLHCYASGACISSVLQHNPERLSFHVLGVQCPIMARKFSQETAPAIAQLLSECSNHLNIVTSAKCQQFRRLMHVL